VLRWLPRNLSHQGSMHGAEESLEATAELALAGGYPITADELDHESELAAELAQSDEVGRPVDAGHPDERDVELAEP
jgi:hypothetical protein